MYRDDDRIFQRELIIRFEKERRQKGYTAADLRAGAAIQRENDEMRKKLGKLETETRDKVIEQTVNNIRRKEILLLTEV